MGKSKSTRARSDSPRAHPAPDDSGAPDPESTASRIIGFLASMQPLPGNTWAPDILMAQNRAIGLMGKMAISARDREEPTLKLTPRDCADILTWMSTHIPLDGKSWWEGEDDAGVSYVCGFNDVLDAMASNLRGGPRS